MVLAMDLRELARNSDRVVIAQVVGVNTRWDARQRSMTSTVELAVEESLKGDAPANRRLRLLQVGGQADGLVVSVSGQPSFRSGERAVLFLEGPADACHLVGMGQGKRPLRLDSSTGRWMADPGDHSTAVVLGAAGGFDHVGPEAPALLSDLRVLVRNTAKETR